VTGQAGGGTRESAQLYYFWSHAVPPSTLWQVQRVGAAWLGGTIPCRHMGSATSAFGKGSPLQCCMVVYASLCCPVCSLTENSADWVCGQPTSLVISAQWVNLDDKKHHHMIQQRPLLTSEAGSDSFASFLCCGWMS
jgi:hypothetical protein